MSKSFPKYNPLILFKCQMHLFKIKCDILQRTQSNTYIFIRGVVSIFLGCGTIFSIAACIARPRAVLRLQLRHCPVALSI